MRDLKYIKGMKAIFYDYKNDTIWKEQCLICIETYNDIPDDIYDDIDILCRDGYSKGFHSVRDIRSCLAVEYPNENITKFDLRYEIERYKKYKLEMIKKYNPPKSK